MNLWKQKWRDGEYNLGPQIDPGLQAIYGTADNFWVFIQGFNAETHSSPQHIGGGAATPNERLASAVGVLSTPLAAIKAAPIQAAERGAVKYIGRLEDLKGIPRSQTLLDELPNLGSPKANYYQNMSVLRKSLRDGITIKDASWFRPNSELAPTLLNPNRTVGQTFLGAERLLLKNRGLWP